VVVEELVVSLQRWWSKWRQQAVVVVLQMKVLDL
jgi:hypothetical protein